MTEIFASNSDFEESGWQPGDLDLDELTFNGHPSGFSAAVFPGASGDYRWAITTPTGDSVAWSKAPSLEEAQAAALQTMNKPPRPYRYGPDDLQMGLYDPGTPLGGGGAAGIWSADDEMGPENWLSGITWGPNGEIGHVETKPDHQRKGLATQLFDYVVQNHRPDLRHSDTLTADGKAWAEAEQARRTAASDFEEDEEHGLELIPFAPMGAIHNEVAAQMGYTDGYRPKPGVAAFDGASMVGHMQYALDRGGENPQVYNVWVDPKYRRRGIATQLWDYLRAGDVPGLQHSPAQTDDGKAWAQAVDARTAARESEDDDELDLHWKWTMEDEPEWLEGMSSSAKEWFADWAKGVDDDQWAEWQSGDDPTYQAAQDDFVEFLQGNIGVDPWTDTEDEDEDEPRSDSEGYDSRAYYLPGADSNDRDFEDRPELPDGHKRYYSPREVNPESDAWSRPETEFEEAEPEQEMLPFSQFEDDPHQGLGGWDRHREYFDPPTDPDFIDYIKDNYELDDPADFSGSGLVKRRNSPVSEDWASLKAYWRARSEGRQWPSDREPIDLWRGESLDLRGPELADVRRMLYGDEFEDGFNLHHSEPVIEGIDDPQAPGDPNLLSDKALARPHPEGWSNPELGSRLLDYITEHMHETRVPLSDGEKRRLPLSGDGGLGRHWSLSSDIADQYSGMERRNPLALPVRMRSQWKGQGEDPYRTNTDGHHDREREVTILPGAPMDIADLEIYNPREDRWHSVLPEPQQRYAATKRLGWLYETLQESWVDDNFETLPWAEEYGDKAWGTFNDWLHDLDDGQFEEWEGLADEEGDLSYLAELIQDDFEDYLNDKGIPLTDEDEESFDPDFDSDPEFEKAGRPPEPDEVDSSHRPQRADDPGKRYFSPRDNNPASDSPARPDLQFSPREFEEPFLPLGEDDDYQWPVEQYADLWRGESLDLGSPELADVRRGLYGDHYEHMYGFTDGMLDFEDFELTAQPWGKGQGPDGTDLDPLQTPQFADRLLDHITENMHHPRVPLSDGERRRLPLTGDGGMGRHWTSDESVAHGYAPGRGMMLPVVVRGEWAGQGEDPYRTNTGGNYPDESEVTLTPGAPVDIVDVQVRDPHEQGVSWQSLPVERQQHLAATLTDFEEAAGTEHAYYPLDRANPDYDYAPSQVRIINPEAQYYGYDGELIDVGENLLYVSIDDGADIVAYNPADVRRVTSRRVVAYDPLGEQSWEEIYADLPDMVHRGIGVSLPDDLHRTVYDESLSPDERARALLQHLITPDARRGPWGSDSREGLGTSWSGNEGVAEDFSRTNADQFTSHNEGEALSAEDFAWGTDEFGDPVGKPGTAVMLHAERPLLEDIDDDLNGDGSGMRYTYHGHGEQEVPVRGGASLGIRGISWRPVLPMGHPDYATDPEEYIRHTFGEPLYYQAARHAATSNFEEDEPPSYRVGGHDIRPRDDDPLGHDAVSAYRGDEAVGYLSVNPYGYISTLSVHPDYRRQGIGTSMLDHFIDAGTVIRGSSGYSPAGKALYEKARARNPVMVQEPDNYDDLFSGRFVHDQLPEDIRGFTPDWNDEDSDRESIASQIKNRARMQDYYGPDWGTDHLNELDHEIGKAKRRFQEQHGRDWRTLARRIAMPTYYHITDNADFELDPDFRPTNNDFSGGSWSPGVFLTNDPEQWGEFYGDERPYIAEIDAPDGLAALDGVMDLRSVGETYVPAKHFDQLTLKGVRPR